MKSYNRPRASIKRELTMELIDRYLSAVKQYLPEGQQDDIIQELAENIRSQREEKEAELGRPLGHEEGAAMLKQLGHPMLMAGRYLPQKQLIGPAVFPYYWFTLKSTIWIALILCTIAACTTPYVADLTALTTGRSVSVMLRFPGFSVLFWGVVGALFAVFGVVTIVFALIDFFQARYRPLDRWDPRKLVAAPRVPAQSLGRPVSRPQAIAQLACGVVFFLGWLAIPRFPMVTGPTAAAMMQAGPGWQTFRLLLLAMVLVGTIDAILNLMRPQWTRWLWPLVHLPRVAGVVWMFVLARSSSLLVVGDGATSASGVDPHFTVRVVNTSIAYGMWLALCFAVLNYGVVTARCVIRYLHQRSIRPAIHLANF
jgi:hypothetical protein